MRNYTKRTNDFAIRNIHDYRNQLATWGNISKLENHIAWLKSYEKNNPEAINSLVSVYQRKINRLKGRKI